MQDLTPPWTRIALIGISLALTPLLFVIVDLSTLTSKDGMYHLLQLYLIFIPAYAAYQSFQ